MGFKKYFGTIFKPVQSIKLISKIPLKNQTKGIVVAKGFEFSKSRFVYLVFLFLITQTLIAQNSNLSDFDNTGLKTSEKDNAENIPHYKNEPDNNEFLKKLQKGFPIEETEDVDFNDGYLPQNFEFVPPAQELEPGSIDEIKTIEKSGSDKQKQRLPQIFSPRELDNDETVQKIKEDLPIEVNADNVEYVKEEQLVKGTGNVVINFKGVQLSADKITVNLLTKDAYAEGNVKIYQGDRLYTAQTAYYNFSTEKGKFETTKGHFKPFYLYGEYIDKPEKKAEYHIKNGYITTSDYRLPDYRLKAKSVEIYPQDKVILKNIVFEVGNIPVFWFPYWYYPLLDKDVPFSMVPGYSKKWGAYLLNSLQVYRSENLKIQFILDLMSKRGVAPGIDAQYKFQDKINGMFKSYFLRDKAFEKYEETPDGVQRIKRSNKDRYRVTLEHAQRISDDTRLLGELNFQSDKQIIDDFFQREFDEQIQRVNFVDLTKATEKYQFELYLSPRFNSFFDVLERLPELSFTQKNARLFNTPLFLETDSRGSRLNFLFDDESRDFDSTRLTSFGKVSLPLYLWDCLNVVPYVDGRVVTYSDFRRGKKEPRGIGTFGINTDLKASKIFPVESKNWNIHGIRHVFEPSVNFKLLRTNIAPERVHQFDLIDGYADDTAFTFNFRNLFQTNRWKEKVEIAPKTADRDQKISHKGIEEVTTDLIDFSLMFDFFPSGAGKTTFPLGHLNPAFRGLNSLDFFFIRNIVQGSPFLSSVRDKYVSDLLFDLKFEPFDWLATTLITRYDPHEQQIEEVTWGFSFFNNDKISWDVYTSFYIGGSTQLSHTFNYRINHDWRIQVSHIFDFNKPSNEGSIVEHQRYSVIKDLHAWELAFSYSDRRYIRVEKEIDRTFYVMFYLKDFPDVKFKVGN